MQLAHKLSLMGIALLLCLSLVQATQPTEALKKWNKRQTFGPDPSRSPDLVAPSAVVSSASVDPTSLPDVAPNNDPVPASQSAAGEAVVKVEANNSTALASGTVDAVGSATSQIKSEPSSSASASDKDESVTTTDEISNAELAGYAAAGESLKS